MTQAHKQIFKSSWRQSVLVDIPSGASVREMTYSPDQLFFFGCRPRCRGHKPMSTFILLDRFVDVEGLGVIEDAVVESNFIFHVPRVFVLIETGFGGLGGDWDKAAVLTSELPPRVCPQSVSALSVDRVILAPLVSIGERRVFVHVRHDWDFVFSNGWEYESRILQRGLYRDERGMKGGLRTDGTIIRAGRDPCRIHRVG